MLDPPEALDYQVTFRYFTDYIRSSNPSLAADATALEAAWQQYQVDFKRRGTVSFFEEMKDQSWFKEKYDPSKEMELLRMRLKKKGREGGMQRFLNEFEAGNLEAISFDYREFSSLFTIHSRTHLSLCTAENRKGSGTDDGDVLMADGDAAATTDASASPKTTRTTNPDLVTIEPNDKQLFIKTITPDVSREELEAVSPSLKRSPSVVLRLIIAQTP